MGWIHRDQPSRHSANRSHYRVRTLKVTAVVDGETLYITDGSGRPRQRLLLGDERLQEASPADLASTAKSIIATDTP